MEGEGCVSEKLKPCPFCGEKKDLEFEKDSNGNWTVECACCGAIGPWSRSKEQARALWDERVGEGE